MLEGILSGLAFSGFFSIRLMPCMTLPIMTTRFVASFYDYYYSYFFNSNYLFFASFSLLSSSCYIKIRCLFVSKVLGMNLITCSSGSSSSEGSDSDPSDPSLSDKLSYSFSARS